MITIEHPTSCLSERDYIFHVLLHEFLGLQYTTRVTETQDIVISSGGKFLVINDSFFPLAEACWLQLESLPSQPLVLWDSNSAELNINLVDTNVPVIYGIPVIGVEKSTCNIGIDIFGSAFFMLTRYEEAVKPDRDQHDRFPATASLAFQEGFLDRPIIDEYVEILWAFMRQLWPELVRKHRKPCTLVSCDVDNPYICISNSFPKTVKATVGDMLKRKSLTAAMRTLNRYLQVKRGNYSQDPYLNGINWIMDINEQANNKVAFYFIPEHIHATYDGCYSMEEPVIRNLIRRIHSRGHEIGLHASYNTYKDEQQFCREAEIIRRVMEEEGIDQPKMGGRQHYLRWETPTTARNWESASMAYDSTLSFADRSGFRCGTCHEYPMYHIIESRSLKLRQRPLVMMECSVIDSAYMGMGYTQEAFEYMQTLKHRCHQFDGDFTLLWHNSFFRNAEDVAFYQQLIGIV